MKSSKSVSSYNLSKLALNIRKHRARLELSRDELGAAAKINYNTVIKLESGANKNPTIKTLIGLANVFRIKIEDLIR